MGLTMRQRDLMEFVRAYWREHGVSPSLQAIGEHFGISHSTASEHLANLEKERWIRRSGPTRARVIELVEPDEAGSPCPANGFTIPPGVRYVPVSSLTGLFSAWLRRRQLPEALGPDTPAHEVPHGRT